MEGVGDETTPPPGPTCETSTETGPPGVGIENCSAETTAVMNAVIPIRKLFLTKHKKRNLLLEKQINQENCTKN
jgi:hypothetical protein